MLQSRPHRRVRAAAISFGSRTVGTGREGEDPADPLTPPRPGLLLSGDGLEPAEAFFDLPAVALANSVDDGVISRASFAVDTARRSRLD